MPAQIGSRRTCRKPKREGLDAHPRTLSRVSPKRPCPSRDTDRTNHSFRSGKTQRLRTLSAPDERSEALHDY